MVCERKCGFDEPRLVHAQHLPMAWRAILDVALGSPWWAVEARRMMLLFCR